MSLGLDESLSPSKIAYSNKENQLKYKIVGSENVDRLQLIKLLHTEAYDKPKPVSHQLVQREVKLKQNSQLRSSMLDIPVNAIANMHKNRCDGVIILISYEEMSNKILEAKLDQIDLSKSEQLWKQESSDKNKRNDIRQILMSYCRLLNQQSKSQADKMPKLIVASLHNKNKQYNGKGQNQKRHQIIKNFIRRSVAKNTQELLKHKMGEIIIDKICEWRLQEIKNHSNSPENQQNLQLIRQQMFQCDFSIKGVESKLFSQLENRNQYKTGILEQPHTQSQSMIGNIPQDIKPFRISNKQQETEITKSKCCSCIIF